MNTWGPHIEEGGPHESTFFYKWNPRKPHVDPMHIWDPHVHSSGSHVNMWGQYWVTHGEMWSSFDPMWCCTQTHIGSHVSPRVFLPLLCEPIGTLHRTYVVHTLNT